MSRPTPDKSRARKALALGLVTLGALGASVLLVNLLAEKFFTRFDATATGQQQLSPRTRQLLASLPGNTRLVVATNLGAADPRALRNLRDVLDELTARQPQFQASLIDTASPAGQRAYALLLGELEERERPALDANVVALRDAIDAGERAGTQLREGVGQALGEALAKATGDARAQPTATSALQQAASLVRVRTDELAQALAKARKALPASSDGSSDTLALPVGSIVPATDEAAGALARVFAATTSDASVLARELRALAQAQETPGGARDAIAQAAGTLERVRDELGGRVQPLHALPTPDIVRLARALSQSEGAVLVGPATQGSATSSLVAIDLAQLLPDAAWIDQGEVARRDLRGRVEELLSSSLASLLSPHRPIVVLVTPDPNPYLGDAPFFQALQRRLASRGMDILEWQVVKADAPDPEALARLDPKSLRPRVYVTLAPETLSDAGGLSGSQRASKLGEAIQGLLASGENVLVNCNPSILAISGGTDPIAAALKPLGIDIDTGTPLFTQVVTPQGIVIETDRVALAQGEHAIARAVGTLPTYVTWALPITTSAGATPVLAVPADADTWGETQWTIARQVPKDQLSMLRDRPKFDEGRDRRAPRQPDDTGALDVSIPAWTIGAAAERTVAGLPQRVVVVGSNTWFADRVTQQAVSVEGRSVQQFPGNVELFDASIAWLARQDATIAQSAVASSVALVRPLSPEKLQRWRIGVIAGPAIGVALLGTLYWLRRR